MTHVLYGYTGSGNCYKVELLLNQLGLDYRWQEVDLLRGESHTADFLARNPNGKVPTLELPDGAVLVESNAMLCHLAESSDFLPAPGLARTRVLEWLFFEQYSHEPYIAVLRAARRFKMYELQPDRAKELEGRGHRALGVMEQQLDKHNFMAGDRYTIADMALFAYTHVADEGGILLDAYPRIRKWLTAVRNTPGFIAMPEQH